MSIIDVEAMVKALSEEAPAGENLEYDPLFTEMERAAEGKEAHQIGDAVVEGEEPDWKSVRDKAVALFERTRDLRAAVYLTRALLRTSGWPGLADGLELVRRLIEEQWDHVHPELDHEDNDDPTMRVNVLLTLCDPEALLGALRRCPLVSSRGLGRFGLRDIDVASGKLDASGAGDAVPEMAAIDAAFMECEIGDLQETADALQLALGAAKAIEEQVTARVGAAQAPNLAPLRGELESASSIVQDRLSRRGAGGAAAGAPAAGGAAAGAPQAGPVSGAVNTREDVIRVIDLVCEYYARSEPSSPVPLLLRRAKRLVSKDFMEILRDLVPDGVSQAELISGTKEE